MIRRRLMIGAALAALFAVGWWAGRGGAAGSDLYQNLDVLVEIIHKIERSYVDPVEPKTLVEGAIRGMLRDLDPYSQFLDTRSYQNLQATTHGSFGGIGVVVSVRDNVPTVISPIEGSPAWTLGLRSGDMIVRIEGASSVGLTVEEVANRLRGPEGTHVQISVRREGEDEEHEYTIERRVIVTKSVPYAFVDAQRTGYVRLANFSENSGAEVRATLDRLRREGAQRLVLDIRSNPGGLLDQAVDVVEQFIKSNTLVVYTKGRARGQNNRYFSSEPKPLLDWPLVVLVDGGSASASEIVAGALQDLDRALVVGETSFGKGSVQSVFALNGRSVALKLTTSLYYTPSGRSIHKPVSTAAHALDVMEDEEALEEDDGRPAAPDSAAPRFKTAAGRTVLGGGGIHPDLIVEPDSLVGLMRRVETRGLAFRFANRWVNAHPEWKAGTPLNETIRRDFIAFLEAEKVQPTPAELSAERAPLDRALRRELARRLDGDGAAARIALEGDKLYARALEILARSRGPRDVFALSRTAKAPGEAGVR